MSPDPHVTPSGLTYDRTGPRGGTPVVLVHAAVADRRMWDPQWPALTAVHDCVRIDMRGYGDAVRAPAGRLDPVGDLLEVLEAEGIERAHLVGSSRGSGACFELALLRPDVAQSLVLCPPGGALLAEMTPDLRTFIDTEDAALGAGDLDAAVAANVAAWVVGPRRAPGEVDAGLVESVAAMQRRASEVQLGWHPEPEEVELDPPATERYDEIRCRTLVVVGDHDLLTTLDAARRVEEGVADVRVDRWPVAHLPSMERPDVFTRLLLDWLG